MKRTLLALLSPVILFISSSVAQTPDLDEQKLLALIKEVKAQQAQIADNQTKIETKLAEVAETVRVARLFAGKAGK